MSQAWAFKSSGTSGGVPLGRFNGQSDIVYIVRGALLNRARQHARVRLDLRDKGWLLAILKTTRELEVGYFAVPRPRDRNRRLERSEMHKAVLGLQALLGREKTVAHLRALLAAAQNTKDTNRPSSR